MAVRTAAIRTRSFGSASITRIWSPARALVDVREPPEWKDGTIDGAVCVPRGVLEWKAESEDELKDKSAALVVYCKTGGRSALAAQTLQELGYTNVKSLAGGFEAWSGKS